MLTAMRCIAALLAATLVIAGCARHGTQPAGTALVAMADNAFSPSVVRVPVGGSVVFHNAGRSAHNAIAIDNSWSTERTFGNLSIPPEQMTEVVFPNPGVYRFYCTFHGTP